MADNINVIPMGKKGARQEVRGVVVNKIGKEFVFNYQTSLDPAPEDIEFLKIFRNRFVGELEQLNKVLGHITD